MVEDKPGLEVRRQQRGLLYRLVTSATLPPANQVRDKH